MDLAIYLVEFEFQLYWCITFTMTDEGSSGSKGRGKDKQDRLSELTKTRQYHRQRVTRIFNYVARTDLNDITLAKRLSYIESLQTIKTELPALNSQIYALGSNMDDQAEFENDVMGDENYEENILEALRMLKGRNTETDFAENVGGNIPVYNAVNSNKIKLPVVSLPEFSGNKNESLEKFFYSLESMIDKHPLSSYERFAYLLGQVRKSPKVLLESLDIEEQTYDDAKQLLQQAFGSTLTQKYDVLDKLSKLKLPMNGDPYVFIGELRSIESSIRNLGIDVKTVVQYFAWSGLNEKFQSQLVQITNCTKPSLDAINQCFFEATERYVKLNERFNESKTKYRDGRNSSNNDSKVMSSLAVNTKVKSFIPCHLCVDDKARNIDHTIKDCKVYPNSRDKLRRLTQLNFCCKCAFKNHSTNACRFKFTSNCRTCNGEHMTYLCPKPFNPADNKFNRAYTSNQMSCVQSAQFSVKDDQVLLPTFTVKVSRDNCTKNREVRVLKDSGSQRNFILQSIADNLNLSVVRSDVELTVHGFNSTKIIHTKIVKAALLIGRKFVQVECVVVPEIKITLNISNLNHLVNAFTKRGYDLADMELYYSNNVISNFGMVIGVEAESFLNAKTVVFGNEENRSSFLDSSLGVLLMGDAQRINDNLGYLQHVDNTVS